MRRVVGDARQLRLRDGHQLRRVVLRHDVHKARLLQQRAVPAHRATKLGIGPYFLECLPKSQCAIGNRKLGPDREAAAPKIEQ